MKLNKILLLTISFLLLISITSYGFDIPLGDDENSISIKTTKEEHEHFDKQLPFGPTSIKFINNSLWVADGLKDRIVEYDTNGNYIKSIQLDMPYYSTIGDFCFGYYGKNKEESIYVCDVDNPIIYVFKTSGQKLRQFGSINSRTILLKPFKIEFFDGKIYVLDSERSNIFVYNTNFGQEKAIVTYSKNFYIENGYLFHMSTYKGMKTIEKYNIENGRGDYKELDIKENEPLDYIASNNDIYYVGREDSEKAKYHLIQYDKNNTTKLDTDLPVSFLVTSFIKNNKGILYQIKFNHEQPTKLSINPIEN